MSQIDDYLDLKGGKGLNDYILYQNNIGKIKDIINNPNLDITSRDDIINPESLLGFMNWNLTPSMQAEYEQLLLALRNVQAQQQASYDEFYNSTTQQVLRDRSAGLNTDILGVSGSAAPETGTNDSSPFDGRLSEQEFNLQKQQINIAKFTSIFSALSSVASLASAFSSLPVSIQQSKNLSKDSDLKDLLIESQDIANESAIGASIASDIADLFATAQNVHLRSKSSEPFNIEQWFAKDENFAELASVYGHNPRFATQLNKQRNAVMKHMLNASQMQKDLSSNINDVGSIISSPFYSHDQKINMIQHIPFIAACAKADFAEANLRATLADIRMQYSNGLDVETAIDASNSQFKYNSDYYQEVNGKLVAAFEQYLRDVSKPAYDLERSINQGYLDLFNSDPSGQGAWKASYLYGSRGGSSWKEAYLLRNDHFFSSFLESELSVAKANGDYASLNAMVSAIDSILSGSGNFISRLAIDPAFIKGLNKYREILLSELANIQN